MVKISSIKDYYLFNNELDIRNKITTSSNVFEIQYNATLFRIFSCQIKYRRAGAEALHIILNDQKNPSVSKSVPILYR